MTQDPAHPLRRRRARSTSSLYFIVRVRVARSRIDTMSLGITTTCDEDDVLTKKTGEARWDSFFREPALSFTSQPLLENLFDAVAHGSEVLTFFLGAGVSIDAGLPTWTRLIDNVADKITDDRWEKCLADDRDDPIRKAEYVTQLAMEGTAATLENVVRDALYTGSSNPTPGSLADAIARLATMLGPDRCRVLTTNFDALFEDALLRHKPTASIKSRSVAKKQPKSPGTYDVLHLHGILRPGSPGEGPIVLTESQFLEHGPRVRDIVQTALERTQVIFVGVSLTDPNLVAPLWRLSNEKKPYKRPYVVTVAAGHTKSAEPKDARAFVIKKSTYLEEKLNVGTIFLKSYAQIPQLFQELALAKADSDQYFSTDSKTSNRYGYRLKRVLDTAYKNIGCAASEDLPVGQDAAALSHNLHEHLYKSDGGLVAELRDIGHGLKSSNNRKLQDLSSRYGSDLDKEHFGLFLWLRSRRAGARRAEYDLRLVGTSVFTHTEAWSLDRVADIVTTSRHDSANAAFLGRLHIQDLDEGREFQLWRTGLAVPFTVTGASSSLSLPDTGLKLDVLSVGVMTLHSSNSIRRQADGTVARPASILGLLQPDQMNELQTRLGEIARDVLGLWI